MEDWEVRLCLRNEERGDPVMIKSGQEACCLKGGEEGRAPPSVWEKYWNKETLLNQTGHSQSRAEGQGQRNQGLEPGGKREGAQGLETMDTQSKKAPDTMAPGQHETLCHMLVCPCAPHQDQLQRLHPAPYSPVILSE